jgi:HAD superfamily hydrolase (TIGR01509 family)
MEPDRSPAQLIADSEGLLLDFDGPICNVYAGSDPARIARQVALAFNLDIDTDDPLDLITHALETGGPVDGIHQALTETEIEAVRTATETPGIRQLVQSYQRPIAIVSNNAGEAIENWLLAANLQSHIEAVVGRDPRHMKPDPRTLRLSGKAINRQLERCVFIGDSLTDAQAAHQAGVTIIALANRPRKRQLFTRAGCGPIVESIHELTPSEPAIPSTG